jgi:hypothetical protein
MDILASPDEVLVTIAAHLPPGLRLSSFSLAHSRLRAAADHATKAQNAFSHTFSMFKAQPVHRYNYGDEEDEEYRLCEADFYDDRRDAPDHRQHCCSNFAGCWFPQHGQHLTKLQLTNVNKGFSTLPRGLKELELHGCGARWHAAAEGGLVHTFGWATCSGGRCDMLYELTSLTKLHMGACSYSQNTIRQVGVATNLKHLTYSCPVPELPSCYIRIFSSHLETDPLRCLTNLTHLELCAVSPTTGRIQLEIDGGKYGYDNAVLRQHLSRLVKPQTLIIRTGSVSVNLAAGLKGLRSMTDLTRLELAAAYMGKTAAAQSEYEEWFGFYYGDGEQQGNPPTSPGGYGRTPWLQGMTALQSLYLKHFIVEPSQLHGLTQLTSLHLIDAVFNSTHLLDVPGKLTRLQHLHTAQPEDKEMEVTGAELEGGAEQAWPPASAAYAGLTASCQLQELSLTNCQLPPGIWPHVFPVGRQLTQLQSLYACCTVSPIEERSGSAGIEAGQRAKPLRLAGSDLACIVAACPNLQELCVW